MHADPRPPAHRTARAWVAGRVRGGSSSRPLLAATSQVLESERETERPCAECSEAVMVRGMGLEVTI